MEEIAVDGLIALDLLDNKDTRTFLESLFRTWLSPGSDVVRIYGKCRPEFRENEKRTVLSMLQEDCFKSLAKSLNFVAVLLHLISALPLRLMHRCHQIVFYFFS